MSARECHLRHMLKTLDHAYCQYEQAYITELI